MGVGKKLCWIAAGYGLSIAGGVGAVTLNELSMSEEIQQGSPGMVAFGDVIVFLLAAGGLSLLPTWFLLRLCLEKAPRALLIAELLIAAIGPASWLAVFLLSTNPNLQRLPGVIAAALGLFIAFVAIPRMALGPVVMIVEAATLFLARERMVRVLLGAALLLDFVPLSWFALHMAAATRF
jgi:hypothetical protein